MLRHEMSVEDIDITETIARVERILSQDKKVSTELRSLIQLLLLIVKLLVDKLGLNSRNSSKAPSTDPNRPRGRHSQAKGEKRKPGGQPGHKGAQLKRVKDPEIIETIDIDRKSLPKGKYTRDGYESRQVIDIIVSRQVTEYRAEVVKDERGNRYVAKFPDEVTRPVQYGAGLKAKAVYMSQQQLIPYERIGDYFSSHCGIAVSPGSIFNFNKEAFEGLERFEKICRRKLRRAEVLHNDETGINVNGKLLWLHSASNEKWTLFFPHEKRGAPAMKAMKVLPYLKGISVHDHWPAYFRFPCEHALCNAHHVRELTRAWEQDDQKWAKNMKRLLLKIKAAVEEAGGSLPKEKAEIFREKYRSLLKRANNECPDPTQGAPRRQGRPKRNKARNLLNRLRDYEIEVLRFMTDDRVPFTNNRSERDLRMTKVQQKISGCFRSLEGARIFCRVRSYLSTCRKQGIQPTHALRLLFAGKSPLFLRA
jgi:transposase